MSRDAKMDALLAVCLLILTLTVVFGVHPAPTLPQCEEDQVIVGVGDFESGRWSEYRCGPALDDFRGVR